MAEVSQRLGTGAFRLSTLINIPCRPAGNGENHGGSLLAIGNVSILGPRTCGAEVRGTGTCEYQSLSTRKEKDPRTQKRSRLRKRERREQNGTSQIIWATVASQDLLSLDLNPSIYLVQDLNFAQAPPTSLPLSPGEHPLPQVSLTVGRMTCWSKQGPGVLIATTCHPTSTNTTTRYYSWKGGSSTSDIPPLHRSKTAYYDILNVSPSATQSQIKTAYYKQSFTYHPDKNQGDEEATHRFSEISEAYTVLGNASLRRKYDSGALSQSDVQGGWRSSSGETASASRPSSGRQQQRARRFSQGGGKTMFDFDAFYQGHYGEQLRREQEMKARKERLEEQQKKDFSKWKQYKIIDVTVGVLLATGGVILFSIIKS